MRKRQRRKLEARERAREARLAQESAAELEQRTVYRVSFGGPTLDELDEAHSYHKTEFIPGTAQARCTTLKRDGVLTAEGAQVYAELSEAAKK